jgi:hypothetical protein
MGCVDTAGIRAGPRGITSGCRSRALAYLFHEMIAISSLQGFIVREF